MLALPGALCLRPQFGRPYGQPMCDPARYIGERPVHSPGGRGGAYRADPASSQGGRRPARASGRRAGTRQCPGDVAGALAVCVWSGALPVVRGPRAGLGRASGHVDVVAVVVALVGVAVVDRVVAVVDGGVAAVGDGVVLSIELSLCPPSCRCSPRRCCRCRPRRRWRRPSCRCSRPSCRCSPASCSRVADVAAVLTDFRWPQTAPSRRRRPGRCRSAADVGGGGSASAVEPSPKATELPLSAVMSHVVGAPCRRPRPTRSASSPRSGEVASPWLKAMSPSPPSTMVPSPRPRSPQPLGRVALAEAGGADGGVVDAFSVTTTESDTSPVRSRRRRRWRWWRR